MRVEGAHGPRRRRTPFRLGVIVLAVAAAGCSSKGASSGSDGDASSGATITIGSLQPLSGDFAAGGQYVENGAELAVAEINAQGGVKALGGAKLKLVSANTTTDNLDQARAAAAQIVDKHPAFIVGGALSTISSAMMPTVEKAGVPYITGSIADALTASGYKYLFRLPQDAGDIGKAAVDLFAQVASTITGGKQPKVALVYANVSSTVGEAKGFVDALNAQGSAANLQIVLQAEYPFPLTNAEPTAAKIKQSGANLILLQPSGSSDVKTLVAALKTSGVDLPIFDPGAGFPSSTQWLTDLGDEVNGQFVVGQWLPSIHMATAEQDELLKKVNDEYVAKYHEKFMSENAGEGYVAVWDGVTAMERAASSDPKKVRDELSGGSFTSGPASLFPPGKVHFNGSGQNDANMSFLAEWCNGDLKTVLPENQKVAEVMPPASCGR